MLSDLKLLHRKSLTHDVNDARGLFPLSLQRLLFKQWPGGEFSSRPRNGCQSLGILLEAINMSLICGMCMVHLRRSPASHNPLRLSEQKTEHWTTPHAGLSGLECSVFCSDTLPLNHHLRLSSPATTKRSSVFLSLPLFPSPLDRCPADLVLNRTPRGRKASATTQARIRPRSASRPPAHHPEPLSHGPVDLFIFSFPVPFLIFPRAIDTAHHILEIPDSHSHHEIPSHQTRTITTPAISASSFYAPKPCIYCHGEPMPRTLRRVVSVVGGQCEGFVCRAVVECTITYGEPLPQGSYCRFG